MSAEFAYIAREIRDQKWRNMKLQDQKWEEYEITRIKIYADSVDIVK